MNIFAKIFEVNNHQLLARKSEKEDKEGENRPCIMFEIQFNGLTSEQSLSFKSEEMRDKTFDRFELEQATELYNLITEHFPEELKS